MEKYAIPKIGHPLLDAEHETMLGFAGLCTISCPHLESRQDCDGCIDGKPEQCRDGLHNILGHVLPYIQQHFEEEESLMKQAILNVKDPMHMPVHLSTHNRLLQQFRAVAAELNKASTGNYMVRKTRQLHDLITHELLDHIYQADEKLIPHMVK